MTTKFCELLENKWKLSVLMPLSLQGLAHVLPKKYKRLPSKYESILPKRKDFEEVEKPKR